MARAGAPPGARLADADVAALSARLAGDAALALPASLLRQGAADDAAGRGAYVAELLRRDPALFLERHGKLLRGVELRCFDALMEDYEVAFHARALAAAASAAAATAGGTPSPRTAERAPPASATAKNRRLAHVEALERAGFFDEDAMRNRAPLLYHHHVGRFADAALPAELRGDGVGPRGVAAAVLRAADAADADARLRAALQREARCPPEEDTDSDADEGGDDVAEADEDALADDDAAAAHGASGEAARAVRLAAFGRVMREHFLAGAEAAAHVDYAAVDADSSLDDKWARVADADAEDAYFEAMAP